MIGKHKLTRLWLGISLVAMTACGSTSNGGASVVNVDAAGDALVPAPLAANTAPTLAQALQISQLVEQDMLRIGGDGTTDGMPGTAFAQVPTANTAFFRGPSVASIFTRAVPDEVAVDTALVEMIGTAKITVDFADNTFSGSVDDMYAVSATTLDTGLVDGSLALSGTLPRTDTQVNGLDGSATGSVAAFGTIYALDINANGILRGTNPTTDVKVRAISLSGEGTVAGSTSLSSIRIVGARFTGGGTGAFVNR